MVSISRRWLILLGSRPCPQVFLFSIEYLFEIFILSCSSQYLLTICSVKIGMYILAAIYHLPLPWRLMHLSSRRLIPLISNPLSRILLIGDILFPALSVILFLTYINMLKTYFFKRKNREIVYTPVYTTFVNPTPYLVGFFLFSVLFYASICRGELVFPVHLIHPHTLLPQSFQNQLSPISKPERHFILMCLSFPCYLNSAYASYSSLCL